MPALQKLSREELELKGSLGYILTPCPKNLKKKKFIYLTVLEAGG
jgi:hypothetical protein